MDHPTERRLVLRVYFDDFGLVDNVWYAEEVRDNSSNRCETRTESGPYWRYAAEDSPYPDVRLLLDAVETLDDRCRQLELPF